MGIRLFVTRRCGLSKSICRRRAADRSLVGPAPRTVLARSLHVDSATQQAFAVVERDDLAAGESALRGLKCDERGVTTCGNKFNRDAGVAVADAGFERARGEDRRRVPLQGVHAGFALEEAGGIGVIESHEEGAVSGTFADDDVGLVVGIRGDTNAFALAERVEMQATVVAEFASVVSADDRAGRVGDVGAEEVGHLDLADEADALAVFFVGGAEAGVAGQSAELGFWEVADREAGVGELSL